MKINLGSLGAIETAAGGRIPAAEEKETIVQKWALYSHYKSIENIH